MFRIFYFLSLLTLASCSSMDEIPIIDKLTEPDYVSSKKSKKLELPPELDAISANDTYRIDGDPTSLKSFLDKDKNKIDISEITNKKEKIKVIKSGNMRWLVVPAKEDVVWPIVENFWEDMGFDVYSSKSKGIIETRWVTESDLNRDKSALGKFDAWLDALANTSSRRKFRTRIENGIDDETTEIYLSQRSLLDGLNDHKNRKSRHFDNTVNPDTVYQIQEYKSSDDEKDQAIVSNYKEDDLEIQYELLRRLMVKLGSSDLEANNKLNNAIEIKKADLINEADYTYLLLNDNYNRAWRRLNLAIDMVGFVVEDKNRSDGVFYVKYSNLELDDQKIKKNKGLISKLAFWQDDDVDKEEDPEGQEMYRKEMEGEEDLDSMEKNDKKWFANWGNDDEKNVPAGEKRFRVRILEVDNGSKVYIDYPNEQINKTKTANSIINILYDYLKS